MKEENKHTVIIELSEEEAQALWDQVEHLRAMYIGRGVRHLKRAIRKLGKSLDAHYSASKATAKGRG